jgi:hypothetical protein
MVPIKACMLLFYRLILYLFVVEGGLELLDIYVMSVYSTRTFNCSKLIISYPTDWYISVAMDMLIKSNVFENFLDDYIPDFT